MTSATTSSAKIPPTMEHWTSTGNSFRAGTHRAGHPHAQPRRGPPRQHGNHPGGYTALRRPYQGVYGPHIPARGSGRPGTKLPDDFYKSDKVIAIGVGLLSQGNLESAAAAIARATEASAKMDPLDHADQCDRDGASDHDQHHDHLGDGDDDNDGYRDHDDDCGHAAGVYWPVTPRSFERKKSDDEQQPFCGSLQGRLARKRASKRPRPYRGKTVLRHCPCRSAGSTPHWRMSLTMHRAMSWC